MRVPSSIADLLPTIGARIGGSPGSGTPASPGSSFGELVGAGPGGPGRGAASSATGGVGRPSDGSPAGGAESSAPASGSGSAAGVPAAPRGADRGAAGASPFTLPTSDDGAAVSPPASGRSDGTDAPAASAHPAGADGDGTGGAAAAEGGTAAPALPSIPIPGGDLAHDPDLLVEVANPGSPAPQVDAGASGVSGVAPGTGSPDSGGDPAARPPGIPGEGLSRPYPSPQPGSQLPGAAAGSTPSAPGAAPAGPVVSAPSTGIEPAGRQTHPVAPQPTLQPPVNGILAGHPAAGTGEPGGVSSGEPGATRLGGPVAAGASGDLPATPSGPSGTPVGGTAQGDAGHDPVGASRPAGETLRLPVEPGGQTTLAPADGTAGRTIRLPGPETLAPPTPAPPAATGPESTPPSSVAPPVRAELPRGAGDPAAAGRPTLGGHESAGLRDHGDAPVSQRIETGPVATDPAVPAETGAGEARGERAPVRPGAQHGGSSNVDPVGPVTPGSRAGDAQAVTGAGTDDGAGKIEPGDRQAESARRVAPAASNPLRTPTVFAPAARPFEVLPSSWLALASEPSAVAAGEAMTAEAPTVTPFSEPVRAPWTAAPGDASRSTAERIVAAAVAAARGDEPGGGEGLTRPSKSGGVPAPALAAPFGGPAAAPISATGAPVATAPPQPVATDAAVPLADPATPADGAVDSMAGSESTFGAGFADPAPVASDTPRDGAAPRVPEISQPVAGGADRIAPVTGGRVPVGAPAAGQAGQALTPEQHRAVLEQVTARLAKLAPGRTVAVALDPPELGRVVIRFVRQNAEWVVKLSAERPDVAQALAKGSAGLESLLHRGDEPMRVEVSVSQDGGPNGQGDGGRGLDGQHAERRDGSHANARHGLRDPGQGARDDARPFASGPRHRGGRSLLDVLT